MLNFLHIKDIKAKVSQKNKKHLRKAEKSQKDNVKIITNDFGEALTRVDGSIPVDLKVANQDRFFVITLLMIQDLLKVIYQVLQIAIRNYLNFILRNL